MSFDNFTETAEVMHENPRTDEIEKFKEKFCRLSPENRDKIALVIILLADCPGFWEDFKEATPEGKKVPPKEVWEALVEKWKGAVV